MGAAGLDPKLVSQLLDPVPGSQLVINAGVRIAMADSIHIVFVIAFVAALLGLVAVLFTPHEELKDRSSENSPPVMSMD